MKQQKWDSRDISDQTGRVAIVTGASSGIGFETARVLADKNATVVLAVRNLEKGNAAADKIVAAHPHADVRIMALDLASLDSVHRFADGFKKEFTRLDLLINNAGVMIPPFSKTEDGFELQFGTNHLGHFALTAHLIDTLKHTGGARIVNVSSTAHKFSKLDLDDPNWEQRDYKAMTAYGDSKVANLLFTQELRRRINGHDLLAVSAHPGWTATELQRHTGTFRFLNKFLAQDIDMGALPTLYAAVASDVESGDYFGPGGMMEWKGYPKKVASNSLSHDEQTAKKLWSLSEKLTGVRFDLN